MGQELNRVTQDQDKVPYRILWLPAPAQSAGYSTLICLPPSAHAQKTRHRFLKITQYQGGDGSPPQSKVYPFHPIPNKRLEGEPNRRLGDDTTRSKWLSQSDLPIAVRLPLKPPFEVSVMAFEEQQGFRTLSAVMQFSTPPVSSTLGKDNRLSLETAMSQPEHNRVMVTGLGFAVRRNGRHERSLRHAQISLVIAHRPQDNDFQLADRFFSVLEGRHIGQTDEQYLFSALYAVPVWNTTQFGPARRIFPFDRTKFHVRTALPATQGTFLQPQKSKALPPGRQPVKAKITERLNKVRARKTCPAFLIAAGQSATFRRYIYRNIIAFHWRPLAAYRLAQEALDDYARDAFYKLRQKTGGFGRATPANAQTRASRSVHLAGLLFDEPHLQAYRIDGLQPESYQRADEVAAVFTGPQAGLRHPLVHGDIVGLMVRTPDDGFILASHDLDRRPRDARSHARGQQSSKILSFIFLTQDFIPVDNLFHWPQFAGLKQALEKDLSHLQHQITRPTIDKAKRTAQFYARSTHFDSAMQDLGTEKPTHGSAPRADQNLHNEIASLVDKTGEIALIHTYHRYHDWHRQTPDFHKVSGAENGIRQIEADFLDHKTFWEAPQLVRTWLTTPGFRDLIRQYRPDTPPSPNPAKPLIGSALRLAGLNRLGNWAEALSPEAQMVLWYLLGRVSPDFLELLFSYDIAPDEMLAGRFASDDEDMRRQAEEGITKTLTKFARIEDREWTAIAAMWNRDRPGRAAKIRALLEDRRNAQNAARQAHSAPHSAHAHGRSFSQVMDLVTYFEESNAGIEADLEASLHAITTPYKPPLRYMEDRDLPPQSAPELENVFENIADLLTRIREKLPHKEFDGEALKNQLRLPRFQHYQTFVRNRLTDYEAFCQPLEQLDSHLAEDMKLAPQIIQAAKQLRATLAALAPDNQKEPQQLDRWLSQLRNKLDRANFAQRHQALEDKLNQAKDSFAKDNDPNSGQLRSMLDVCEIKLADHLADIAHLQIISDLQSRLQALRQNFAQSVSRTVKASKWDELRQLRELVHKLSALENQIVLTETDHIERLNTAQDILDKWNEWNNFQQDTTAKETPSASHKARSALPEVLP